MAKLKKFTVEQYGNDAHGDIAIELAWELIFNIRQDDEKELEAVGDPLLEVYACLVNSEEAYIYRDTEGNLLCLVGIAAVDNADGRGIWMLGTEHLKGYVQTLLIKEARRLIEKWVNEHERLYNCVYENNQKSIRWLTMLGAKFNPEPVEINNKRFFRFEITKEGGKE